MEIDMTAGSKVHYEDIITDRLILRQSNDDRDLENYLFHLKSDDEFYIHYGVEYSDEFAQMISFSSGKVIYYSVFLKEQDVMVGYVGIAPHYERNEGEIEYYIFKERRRNHYASEALLALMNWFMDAELTSQSEKRIVAETMRNNEASCKLLEYLGFEKEALGIWIPMSAMEKNDPERLVGIGMTLYAFSKK